MILTRQQALDIFRRRVSTRYYDPARKISAEDFAAILDFGRLSPSSVGSEPWKFLVIQNQELREKIKPVAWGMQATIAEASHLVILLAKKHARYDSPFFSELMNRRGFTPEQRAAALERYRSFQIHDIAIADDERALFDWASKQSYIALANMLTGAAMLGIDSCPIEGMDYAAVEHILAQAGLLDPAEYGVSVAATFGYRARDIQPKPRRDAAETVVWAE
ncbi:MULTISPECIES: NAD(P)H-dependent oxidoreductase [Eikenella]|uniref:NAD(P)H-dependent oxidoreductase n=1 Tax=Eikenella corrodens TaxID=539 RepID=A0A1A9RFC7_EIKCO|nr:MULTISPECIES: NAD(P)H-dependent oxidoreductase [Eikenella]MDU4301201.1 NAD(P)H-dependent oxidoreductase [Eikenella corrodens]OAM17706.1 NAD(P)H-dependent oxidoreductase [Eikenella corrodens]OAM27418.1 NAD(P)H-dependent oxidoreductase [Eikenella corrodens]OFN63407.1 NAD(P)H-dependent oxidoreductase [Eikenella sp. HMSC061C02]